MSSIRPVRPRARARADSMSVATSMALLPLLLLLSACADVPPPEPPLPLDAYVRALSPWMGQDERALHAAWGPAELMEPAPPAGHWLVYVARRDPPWWSHVSIGVGGFGAIGGGHVGVGGGVTVPLAAFGPDVDCVTRFLVDQGVVVRWTAEGGGCRRPPAPAVVPVPVAVPVPVPVPVPVTRPAVAPLPPASAPSGAG